jgi:hypothetical protein
MPTAARPARCNPGSRRPIPHHRKTVAGDIAAARLQPAKQTQTLYTMGELRADELARLMTWWRDAYEEANEVITVGSYGPSRKTPEERQKYLDFHNVPHEVVEQWDSERAKGAA